MKERFLISFRENPLAWLMVFLVIRHGIALHFHGATYYADEYKDYFTTLHGLINDHRLGEWYTRTNMRSYVILMPLLPFVAIFKWMGFQDIYTLEQIIKTAIGFFSCFTLFFLFRFTEIIADRNRAVFISFIYIFHPVNIYFNYSILTEQAAALTFVLSLWLVQHLLTSENHKTLHLFTLYSLIWLSAGFSVLARLDSLFFMAPLILYYLWHDRQRVSFRLFFASFIIVFLLYGFLEFLYTDRFYGPQINRFIYEGVKRRGVIGSVTNRLSIVEDLGGNVFYPFLIAAGYYFLKTFRRPGILHFPILFFLIFHTWLPHKEFRYVFPIAMIINTFLFINLPVDFLKFNVKKKIVGAFWSLAAVNWVAITFFLTPWGGQPLLSQQIAYVNHFYKNIPVFIVTPPEKIPGADWDPFLEILNFSRISASDIDVSIKPVVIFVHYKFLKEWEKFPGRNKCDEIYKLRDDARKNIEPDFFIHYLCGKDS